jgi:Arc/MetJ family transcription regulator
MTRTIEFDRVAVGARVVPPLEIGIDDPSAAATIAQLGLVFQAAAVIGAVKTLAAVRISDRDSNSACSLGRSAAKSL